MHVAHLDDHASPLAVVSALPFLQRSDESGTSDMSGVGENGGRRAVVRLGVPPVVATPRPNPKSPISALSFAENDWPPSHAITRSKFRGQFTVSLEAMRCQPSGPRRGPGSQRSHQRQRL